ncbi:DUF4190 domain-containing protein [Krasilnikovia sp. MM14-A1259]|uniref:DUF4190 domain-containing protein n=1 Tax=Krasilnikovia sp. MM14-A1259 TaxID=3373539 RepID=UPI0038293EB0
MTYPAPPGPDGTGPVATPGVPSPAAGPNPPATSIDGAPPASARPLDAPTPPDGSAPSVTARPIDDTAPHDGGAPPASARPIDDTAPHDGSAPPASALRMNATTADDGAPPVSALPALAAPAWFGAPGPYVPAPDGWAPARVSGHPYAHGAPQQPTDGLAIASIIISCLAASGLCAWGFTGLLGVVGAVTGHVSRRRIHTTGGGGAGLALAGVIVGWISAAIGALIMVVLVAFAAIDTTTGPA